MTIGVLTLTGLGIDVLSGQAFFATYSRSTGSLPE